VVAFPNVCTLSHQVSNALRRLDLGRARRIAYWYAGTTQGRKLSAIRVNSAIELTEMAIMDGENKLQLIPSDRQVLLEHLEQRTQLVHPKARTSISRNSSTSRGRSWSGGHRLTGLEQFPKFDLGRQVIEMIKLWNRLVLICEIRNCSKSATGCQE